MQPLDLLILTLATYYAAVTLAKLHGPFGMAERMREAVYRRRGFQSHSILTESGWVRVPASQEVETLDDDWLASGVSCPLCMSLYCGAVLALAWYAGGAVGQGAIVVLAVAGGASLAFSVGRTW